MTHRFLKGLKERTLDEPFTAERSEIVDRIDQWEDKMKQSGFEDDIVVNWCKHPQHNPPMYMVIPHGKKYRHVCPECGQEVVIRSTQGCRL